MKKVMIAALAIFTGICIFGTQNVGATTEKPSTNNVSQVVYGTYCCDNAGNRRCAISPPGPVNSSCFCYNQGYGWICL